MIPACPAAPARVSGWPVSSSIIGSHTTFRDGTAVESGVGLISLIWLTFNKTLCVYSDCLSSGKNERAWTGIVKDAAHTDKDLRGDFSSSLESWKLCIPTLTSFVGSLSNL